MSTDPGVDELLARQHLRDLGVGHHPTAPEDDWWTALYPDDAAPAVGAAGSAAPRPDAAAQRPGRLRKLSERLPDWRKGVPADLPGHRPDTTDTDQDGQDEEAEDEEAEEDWGEAAEQDDPARPHPPRPGKPVRRPARRAKARYVDLNPRTRALLYNGTAAGAGYVFGLVPQLSTWITNCQHDTHSIGTALTLGTGIVIATGALIDRRTRTWWPPLAWICRIPLASALLAVALYAPASATL